MAKKRTKTTPKPAEKSSAPSPIVWIVIGALAVAAMFGGYQLLAGRSGSPTPSGSSAESAPITGPEVDGAAVVSGGVQKISIAVSNVYNPNVIILKAGVPAELTFSGGQGCTVNVQSQSLGFNQSMSAGPTTVKLPGLQPGTYPFACGMNMVHGRIVVR